MFSETAYIFTLVSTLYVKVGMKEKVNWTDSSLFVFKYLSFGPGLSCCTQDLRSSLQLYLWNVLGCTSPGLLRWECGVLARGPPGRSSDPCFYESICSFRAPQSHSMLCPNTKLSRSFLCLSEAHALRASPVDYKTLTSTVFPFQLSISHLQLDFWVIHNVIVRWCFCSPFPPFKKKKKTYVPWFVLLGRNQHGQVYNRDTI